MVGPVNVLLCVSVTEEQSQRLRASGPRRDFLELAAAVDGEILYQPPGGPRRRLLRRIAGPHLRQAWIAARHLSNGDAVYADGEHVMAPLALFLFLRRKRRVRMLALGHFVERPWKIATLALATRLVPTGAFAVHSQVQRERVRRWVGRGWALELVPYQVDTEFWCPAGAELQVPPVILGVGAEHRDYRPMVAGLDGEPVRVRIAAGSHWARKATSVGMAANLEVLTEPLPFDALREEYRAAAAVVVPLEDIGNQSGITVMLEAMSMARPLVVTASRGQRECVQGPLVRSDGSVDTAATADRGPAAFGDDVDDRCTGLYVPVDDADAIRQAVRRVVNDSALASELGSAARLAVERHFTIERYVATLRRLLLGSSTNG